MTESAKKQKITTLLNQSSVIEVGTPTRYRLEPKTHSQDQFEHYRKLTFGVRDENKPHKTILMVGETGSGKTKLINAMINYVLGVQREDKVWFEITDDQSNRSSPHSQTSIVTIYEFYLQESKSDLRIIDTPGYGDTRDVEKDKKIAVSLCSLSRCDNVIDKINAVCLVIMAQQNRLCDRQQYIFDAVQSLFGCDIGENIVLLFTHSRGAHPKNALMAVKEAQIRCAVDEQKQPVFFLFDNCQGETFDEEYSMVQKQSWNLSLKEMTRLFTFLDNIKSKPVQMTQNVLQKQKHLEAIISDIQKHVQKMTQKQKDLNNAQGALKQSKESVEKNKNFEYEVEVTYKEKVDIDPAVALCCTVCEENCHYPGCWKLTPISWCEVMKSDHCTVCTNNCHYTEHVKGAKIYQTNTKTEKRTNEILKKEYNDKIAQGESLVKKLEEERPELEKEKLRLVIEAYHCVDSLQMIALNTDPLIILQHIDFMIEMLKEINQPEKAETLESIKIRAREEKKKALEYITGKNKNMNS